jgi:hypothetical protein
VFILWCVRDFALVTNRALNFEFYLFSIFDGAKEILMVILEIVMKKGTAKHAQMAM